MALDEQEAQAIVNRAVILLNEYEKYLHLNAYSSGPSSANSKLNFVDHADLLITAASLADTINGNKQTDLQLGIHSSIASFRSGLSGVKSQAASFLAHPIRILGAFYKFTEDDPSAILDRIFDYFVDTGRRIKSRGLTIGSLGPDPASGSNTTGCGTVHTRSTMSSGDPVDNIWTEKFLWRCISDEHSGATEHREAFSIEGEPAHTDGITIAGSGAYTTATAVTPSQSLALNSSFTSYSGAVTTPVFTNWTATGGTANIDAETIIYYRDSTGESAPVSLKFNANDTIKQNFNVRRIQFDTTIPYLWHIAYKPTASATGNVTVKIGGNSVSTTAFDGSASTAWKVASSSLFFSNLNEEDPDIEIAVTSLSGGQVYLDDFIFAPMSEFNGLYYLIVGGEEPFMKGDGFSLTVSQSSKVGLVNEWLWKAYNKYLPCEASPNASATPKDWIDPTDYS